MVQCPLEGCVLWDGLVQQEVVRGLSDNVPAASSLSAKMAEPWSGMLTLTSQSSSIKTSLATSLLRLAMTESW